MENAIGLTPIELNEIELYAVSGGFSLGGFNVSLKHSNISDLFNNSGNVSINISNEIDINLVINL